jgi:hypothetical protein
VGPAGAGARGIQIGHVTAQVSHASPSPPFYSTTPLPNPTTPRTTGEERLHSTRRRRPMLRAALLRSGSGLRRPPMAAPLSTAAAASWLSDSASSPPRVRLLIGGEFVESRADEHVDVTNPATQEVVSRIPLTTADEFRAAVDAARTAFPGWRNTPVTTRQRIMLKYQELIRANMDKLAENITTEQGKTLKDAWGDVFRGLGWFSDPYSTWFHCFIR